MQNRKLLYALHEVFIFLSFKVRVWWVSISCTGTLQVLRGSRLGYIYDICYDTSRHAGSRVALVCDVQP